MRKKINILITVLCLASIFLSGCKSTKEYARFAKAGSVYNAAMDNLLLATSNISINANSERLLAQDHDRNLSEDEYKKTTTDDKDRLKIINELRNHAGLVSDYYDLLFQLASSDAPQQTQDAISGVVTNLDALGNTLRGSGIYNSSIAAPLSGAIVTTIIRGKLRDEIKQRSALIQRELDTQKILLDKLKLIITANLLEGNSLKERRKVIDKIINSAELTDTEKEQWIIERRNVVTATNVIYELEVASKTVTKMQAIINALNSNKLTLERIDSFLTDLETFLSITEALKNK